MKNEDLYVYKKSDFYEDFISSQKEYYEREQVDTLLAQKDREIALLKERICNGDVSRLTWIDDCIAKDKVIADLEKKIKFLQVTAICKDCNKCAEGMGKVFDENLDELKAQKAQAEDDCAYWKTKAQRERHQNFKRCLAMALVWFERAENSTDWKNELVSRKRFSKWLELAEKFKPNSTLQQKD